MLSESAKCNFDTITHYIGPEKKKSLKPLLKTILLLKTYTKSVFNTQN